MSDSQRRWLERGGWLAAFLLPLVFNPLVLDDPFEPTKTLLFQVIVLGMVVVAVWPGGAKDRRWPPNPLAVPVWLYGVVVGLATAVSIDPRISLWGGNIYRPGTINTLALLLFFFLLATTLRTPRQIDQLINLILIGSVPVALYGLIQYVGLDPIDWRPHSISPIHSTMGRSIYLGGYLAMIIPFTLVRLIQARADDNRRQQVAFGILLLLQLSCLLFTLARGAWLGFTVGIALFAILLARRQRSRRRLVLLLLIVGLAVVAFITNDGWQLLTEPNTPRQLDLSHIRQGSDNARLVTWRTALALIPDRWLLGYGPETFATAVAQYKANLPNPHPDWMYLPDPHNLLLNQVTAVGLAGLAAFLWLIGRFYALLLAHFRQKSADQSRLLLAACLSSVTVYLIQAQFNPDMITLSMVFWLNLVIGIILVR